MARRIGGNMSHGCPLPCNHCGSQVAYLQNHGDLIDKEVEELMLRESDENAIAGLQAQVAGLTEQVRQLKDQAQQVSTVVLNVEALSAKFKERDSAMRMDAYVKLSSLRLYGTIADCCVELEKLSRTAYPVMTKRELSTLRSGELITQLTAWPEYVQLFTVLEQAPSFDLHNDVEEIPNVDRIPIFNASGNQMLFKGVVRLTLAVDGGSKRRVAFFVLKGGDGMPRRAAKAQKTKSDNHVKVVSRLYIKHGETKTIELLAAAGSPESVLWSSDKLVPNAVCDTTSSVIRIPVANSTPEVKVYKDMGNAKAKLEDARDSSSSATERIDGRAKQVFVKLTGSSSNSLTFAILKVSVHS
ncbi:unnamed protein product [Heligmosomoides polygyrus]|uniref:t-SNARE coiled-coil homology domain-containing protein n=1 Tax=Heligmosomoides polygyrus TaxID=6339 RepID=A0A183GJF8_HELPZ|nr:unnamed protein product [Heligmosomoides polygyrus]